MIFYKVRKLLYTEGPGDSISDDSFLKFSKAEKLLCVLMMMMMEELEKVTVSDNRGLSRIMGHLTLKSEAEWPQSDKPQIEWPQKWSKQAWYLLLSFSCH